MGLTKEQANAMLHQINTPDELRDLIKQLDITAHGDVTVLFSGIAGFNPQNPGKSVLSMDVVSSLTDRGENIRVIGTTEAGKFLSIGPDSKDINEPLLDALDRIFGSGPEKSELIDRFFSGDIVDGKRIPNGVWDDVSGRFVAATVGEIITLTGGATFDRVFAQTELLAILNSDTITHVDGIPIATLRSLGHEGAFHAIRAQSESRSAELRIAVDENGNAILRDGQIVVDARRFLAHTAKSVGLDPPPELSQNMRWVGEMIPNERIKSHAEGILLLREAEFYLQRQIVPDPNIDQLATNKIIRRALEHLGTAADILDLAMIAVDVNAALQAGDATKAKRIISTWALENLAAFMAARVATLAFTPLIAAGPIGMALFGAVLVGSSIGGGMLGSKLADWLQRYLDPWNPAFQLEWLDRTTYRSPMILDLDGDGVETLNVYAEEIYFDHDSNAFAERTGWVSPDDGLLARDINQDGQINGGNELFGDATLDLTRSYRAQNGYQALIAINSFGDDWIDDRDVAFPSLFVWKDANRNARLDAGEALSLQELGIQAISLNGVNSLHIDDNGNQHLMVGSYLKADGSLAAMHDVWFKIDRVDARYEWNRPIPASISRLPDIPGLGTVLSLHHAMVNDESGRLQLVVESWLKGNLDDRSRLLPELIHRWAGVDDLVPDHPYLSRDDMLAYASMERFAGRDYRGELSRVPLDPGWYHGLFNYFASFVNDQLLFQVELAPLLGKLALKDSTEGNPTLDIGGLLEYWRGRFKSGADPLQQQQLGRFIQSSGVGECFADLRNLVRQAALQESDEFCRYLLLFATDELIAGGLGDDRLTSSFMQSGMVNPEACHFLLDGGPGADSIYSGPGGDILIGGAGDDTLNGGGGSDTFVFGRGDGKDTIQRSSGLPNDRGNVLFFRPGISPADLRLNSIGNDGSVVIMLNGGDEQITLEAMVPWQAYREAEVPIQEFAFADGTRLFEQDIRTKLFQGSPLNDLIRGSFRADNIHGQDGADSLNGGLGDDTLSGGLGDDLLEGGGHNDVLCGGAGQDTLRGGGGSDIYLIGRGWGDDLIDGQWSLNAKPDQIQFLDGITSAEIRLTRFADDLIIEMPSSGDTVTAPAIFSTDNKPLAAQPISLRFADDSLWSFDQMRESIVREAEQSQIIYGNAKDNRVDGGAGHDQIFGAEGQDLLLGGSGNDTIEGGPGRDSLDGGLGDDWLIGGDGDDLFYGSASIGRDTIQAGPGDDLLIGGPGSNLFLGGPGNDSTIGGPGNDTLYGGPGDDSLFGGEGQDCLRPGLGRDTLSGGVGADRFSFLRPEDAGLGLLSHDLITDFQPLDRLDFAAIDADPSLPGDQPFRFIASAPFSEVGQLRYTIVNGDGLLEGHCLGSLDADFQITILGGVPLQSSSFVL